MSTFWVEHPIDAVMVEGPDAVTYLHSQLSQDLQMLDVGRAAGSFVLEPNGRVQSLVRVVRTGDHAFVLDVDAGHGDALVERLRRFLIRVKAEVTLLPPGAWRCVAVRGEGAAAVTSAEGGVAVPAWWGDDTTVDLVGPSPTAPAGVPQGTLDDLEVARVSAGWPAMGREITESSIPAELGVTAVAVSFTKGCYPGQELVERMDSRGSQAPRTLRRLPSDGLHVGAPVVVDGDEVGVVTSVAGPWALALVKRSAAIGDVVQAPSV